MRIAIITQYFWPESVGAGVLLHQLASDLAGHGHQVTVVTTFPNYPEGQIAKKYQRQMFMRELVDGVEVIRTWIYATASKNFWRRVLNYGSFCASAAVGGAALRKADVIYCIMPPLPLGVTATLVGFAKRAPVVIGVEDIYPEIAVKLGYLRNPLAIRAFEKMESWIYRHAAQIVVISELFRENLLGKGVPPEKLHFVPNWADADEIQPGPKNNCFRQRLGGLEAFTVIYAGSLSLNSALENMLDAACLLRNEACRFVLVGDGVLKQRLQAKAEQKKLNNVQFLPFQPREEYPLVLAAADVQLVSLNAAASALSMPSKALKIMAAGRPILAQASAESELARLVQNGKCGIAVAPDNAAALAEAIHRMAQAPALLEEMGKNARRFFERNFDRRRSVDSLESILFRASGQDRPAPGPLRVTENAGQG